MRQNAVTLLVQLFYKCSPPPCQVMPISIHCDTRDEADLAWGWLCGIEPAPVDVALLVGGVPVARISGASAQPAALQGHSFPAADLEGA